MNQAQTIALYQPMLHTIAYNLVRCKEDAEDIVQLRTPDIPSRVAVVDIHIRAVSLVGPLLDWDMWHHMRLWARPCSGHHHSQHTTVDAVMREGTVLVSQPGEMRHKGPGLGPEPLGRPEWGPSAAGRHAFSNPDMLLETRQGVLIPSVICACKDYLHVLPPGVPALAAIALNPASGPGSFAAHHCVSHVSKFAARGAEAYRGQSAVCGDPIAGSALLSWSESVLKADAAGEGRPTSFSPVPGPGLTRASGPK